MQKLDDRVEKKTEYSEEHIAECKSHRDQLLLLKKKIYPGTPESPNPDSAFRIVFIGGTGTGKTFAICSLMNLLILI